jgi:hypothetical protein
VNKQPAWVVRTIIGVAGLLALLLWFIVAGQPRGANPGAAATEPIGTGGAGVERVPGATSGQTAEGDTRFFPSAPPPGTEVAYFDKQPLFVATEEPVVNMPDRDMILEERANEASDQPKYGLYVPAARASGKTSARFYYLKLANGRYLKVSLTPQTR